MLIASKRELKQFTETPNIVIGRHSIKQVTKKKVFGIILNEWSKWNEHNDAQCRNMSKSTENLV